MKHVCKGWHSDLWSPDQCRVCWLKRDPRTQRYTGASEPAKHRPTAKQTPRITLPTVADCAHKGGLMSRPSSCSKTWRYECGVFGSCTTAQCETCEAYVSDATPDDSRRHLAYYVYPVSGNGTWQRNVEQLLDRIDLFNGRRIISIATRSDRHKLDSPDAVREMFVDTPVDFMLVPHGAKKLGEVTAFVPMLTRLQNYKRPTDFTFYAHTKGVTKDPNNPAVHRWTTLMYKANLDRWNAVKNDLATHCITGAFRKFGLAFGGRVARHYTGTFYWLRNADVFARDWRNVPQRYGGTEMWPGMLFTQDECGCHFFDASGRLMYDPRNVEDAERQYHG